MLFFIVAVMAVIFAYAVYDPLPPEDFKQPWRLRIELAVIKFIHLTVSILLSKSSRCCFHELLSACPFVSLFFCLLSGLHSTIG